MSIRNWTIVLRVAVGFVFVFGILGLYPFAVGDSETARRNPLTYLWFGLDLVSLAIALYAHFRITYAETRGGVMVYLIWLLLVLGIGTGLTSLILRIFR